MFNHRVELPEHAPLSIRVFYTVLILVGASATMLFEGALIEWSLVIGLYLISILSMWKNLKFFNQLRSLIYSDGKLYLRLAGEGNVHVQRVGDALVTPCVVAFTCSPFSRNSSWFRRYFCVVLPADWLAPADHHRLRLLLNTKQI